MTVASYEEPVTFTRDGQSVTLSAAFDPAKHLLYLDEGSDVRAGDLATLRGYSRLVVARPEVWTDGGIVAHLEPDLLWLPDLCTLERSNGDMIFDPVTNTETRVWAPLGADLPCLVEAITSKSSEVLVGQQETEVQPYTITLPLTVPDIRKADRITVTRSRNTSLINRRLVVTRLPAQSLSEQLVLLAKEEQA